VGPDGAGPDGPGPGRVDLGALVAAQEYGGGPGAFPAQWGPALAEWAAAREALAVRRRALAAAEAELAAAVETWEGR
jgi:hypothetical protein